MMQKLLTVLLFLVMVVSGFAVNEVTVNYESGNTLYFIIREADGLDAYDTTADTFEAWNAMGDYDISLTDKSGSCYTADFEAEGEVAAGIYIIQAFERVGGTADDDDPLIGSEEFIWSGTAEETVIDSSGQVDVGDIEGSDATDQIRDSVVDDATRIDASVLNTHSAITAAGIVNEWETQSQADPTGFHVNVLETNGTSQTANDNGADINAILTDTGELQTDDYPTSIAALQTTVDAIEADTEAVDTTTEMRTFLTGSDTPVAKESSVTTIDGIVDNILADTETDGVVVASASKTGYKLASDGLDSVSVAYPGTDVSAYDFRDNLMWLILRFAGKTIWDGDTGTLEVRNDADNGNISEQSFDKTGNTQTVNELTDGQSD